VRISVDPDKPAAFDVYVRIPAWCRTKTLRLNGNPVANVEMVRGYARFHRTWKRGDTIELEMPMPVERVRAHPRVDADVGRIALMRGPIVYCLESADNGEGVRDLAIPPEAKLSAEYRADFLGGVTVVKGAAMTWETPGWGDSLYLPFSRIPRPKPVEFQAVPYFANTNRGPVDMLVWVREALLLNP